MWIFTKFGFISVVQKKGDQTLTVRARALADLGALRAAYFPEMTFPRKTSGTDYPYRARISHADFAAGMAKAAADIDYDNFKNKVAQVKGMDVERVYAKVWAVLNHNAVVLDADHQPHKSRVRG